MPLFPLTAPEAGTATAETLRARSGLRVLVDERCLGVGRRQFDRRIEIHPDIRRRRTG
jgi:hypothetical protein